MAEEMAKCGHFGNDDDMLTDNSLASKSGVSKNNQILDENLLVINSLLHEDLQKISQKLEEEKKTTEEFAGKDIQNQTEIFELEDKLNTLQKSFDNLREEKSNIEHLLEQQKTANVNERQRLRREMTQAKNSHNKELKKEIEREICRLNQLNTDLQTRHESELVQIHRKLAEEKETQNKKHKKDLDEMRKKMESKIAKKDEEIEKAKTEIQKHKDEISKITRDSCLLHEKQLHDTKELLDESYQYQQKMHETLRSEIKENEMQLQPITYKFNQSLQEIDIFHQQVQALTAEKKDLVLRFSKVASVKMMHNNPSIVDLSGEYRPTKLAEEFSELYDNEWTDAFEEIEGENEKEKLRFLYELLMRANQVCMDLSNRHTRKVKQSIATLTLLKPNRQEQHRTGECLDKEKLRQGEHGQNLQEKVQAKDGSESQTEGECVEEEKGVMNESQYLQKTRLESDFEKLQTEQKKTILEATKYFERLLSEDVKKAVTEVIVNEKGIDDEKQKCVVVYIEKCIDLCWSMLKHKPPVHVDFSDIISGTPFDTNKYKPYTKTGKHLAYIVWPALYLYEGGPLLSKGVAQGK